jgi:hypothetical protein
MIYSHKRALLKHQFYDLQNFCAGRILMMTLKDTMHLYKHYISHHISVRLASRNIKIFIFLCIHIFLTYYKLLKKYQKRQ